MKKQFVLISGLASVATLAVAGLAVARGNTVLADPVAPGDYVAVINSENRIKNDGTGHNAMNGFRLHGGEEYGQFSLSNLEKINMNEEGYGFSITMASSFYFNIKTSDLGGVLIGPLTLTGKSVNSAVSRAPIKSKSSTTSPRMGRPSKRRKIIGIMKTTGTFPPRKKETSSPTPTR